MILSTDSTRQMLLLWALVASFIGVQACTPPNSTGITPEMENAINGVLTQAPYAWIPLAQPFIGCLLKLETSVQFRTAAAHGSNVYNVAAKYHETALDIWGLDEDRFCVSSNDIMADKEAFVHREAAITYAFAYSGIRLSPACTETITKIMDSLGLPMSKIDGATDPATPWGIAKKAVDELQEFFASDGWNADGSLSAEYNRMPYRDFSYEDNQGNKYEEYKVERTNVLEEGYWPWTPLLESDGMGYFTRQEHVTPHVGFTGRLLGMDKSHYEGYTADPPEYDYKKEVKNVVKETKDMAEDDERKMLIEYFDSKLTSLLPMQINWSIQNGSDQFDFWFVDMALVIAMYDALLVVWKEKVVYNAVRPTTVVHQLAGDSNIKTYGGPFEGVVLMKGKDWQPYIRTMPHAEYPSGSACICTAFAETLEMLSGSNEISPGPQGAVLPAGSSFKEPGLTPSSDVSFSFETWSDVARACGESRVYGGMHFNQAVPAGSNLCSNNFVGPVIKNVLLLKKGDSAGALADKFDSSIIVTPKRSRRNRNRLHLGSGSR